MNPPSYRIEKAIYCIWHALYVFIAETYRGTKELAELQAEIGAVVGETAIYFISTFFFFYTIWQIGLFFLHAFNAIFGVDLFFNVGSWRLWWLNQWYLALSTNLEANNGPTPYRNINNVMRFRNARMGAMGQEEGAELLVETSVLDHVASGASGSNHKRAADFLNAKLGAMGQRDGLEYVKGRKL